MLTKRVFIASMLSMAVTAALPLRALAAGGPSGPKVKYQVQGLLGEVVVNPYRIAPLTAIIRNGGYVVTDATVRIVPKPEGQEIKYKVSDVDLLTHSGIPVFGLYADWVNTVEVSYTRTTNGTNPKSEKITESYRIYCGPAYAPSNGTTAQKSGLFNTKVIKVEKGFEDRLYLVNNILDHYPQAERAVWNNPTGGSLEWGGYPQVGIIDTKGELRWYLHAEPIFDASSIYQGGVMMGFRQNDDGMLTWGYGQRYAKYDIMGREVFNRRLPEGYDDFSHALEPMQNGNYLVRVSSANYKRPDGRNVRTVRDVIIEVDSEGRVVDEWNLNNILDPYRSTVIKTLDQGAVCLNIDAKLAGHTMSAEELAAIDKSDNFGDILGTGAGRNWAHVNSVDYDPTDDSIIISSRHQSAIVKIGRDKKVKWIVGSHEGWTGDFAKRLLKPVDASGNPIECDEYYNVCKKDFDWTWTQHTAWSWPRSTRATTSATSSVRARAETGPTSTPWTTTRPMTRSSFPPVTSPPSSRSAATRRSSGSWAPMKAGRVTSRRGSSSRSTLRATPSSATNTTTSARRTSTGPGPSTPHGALMPSPTSAGSTFPSLTMATVAAWSSPLCPI